MDFRVLSVGVDVDVGGSAECWTPRVICMTDSVCVVEIRVCRLGDVWYESTSGGSTAVTSRSRAGDVSWYVFERIVVVSSVYLVIGRQLVSPLLVSATPSASDFSVSLIG